MIAALLVLLALAAPLSVAGSDGCPPLAVHAAADASTTVPSEPPCDSDGSCPASGECCAVCVSCCASALRSPAAHLGAAVNGPDAPAPATAPLHEADPGCSVWHPPRG